MDGDRTQLQNPPCCTPRSPGLWVVWLAALVLVAALCAPVSAAVIASSDLENNTGWTKALGNWPTFDNAVVYSGTNSMKFVNSADRMTRSPAATSGTVALRFWFYDADASTLGGSAPYVDLRTAGGATTSFIGFGLNNFGGVDAGKYGIRGGSGQGSTTWSNGSVARTLGWHRVELLYKVYSASDHHYTVLVDDTPAYTGTAFTGAASFGMIYVGNGSGTNPCTPQFRLDTLALLGAPRHLSFTTAGGATGQIAVSLVSGGGLQTGVLAANHTNGLYDAAETLSITAPTVTGFSFSGWTSNSGGTFGDPNAPATTYTGATGDGTVTANYTPTSGYLLTIQANPPSGVSAVLPGVSTVQFGGTSVAVSATIVPGYTFSRWTDDASGNNTVSASLAFSYTMPNAPTALYCWTTLNNYTLSTSAGNGGTVSGDSGTRAYTSSCTVTATANPNFRFVCWSTNAAGSAPVSASPSYTFTMPASDYSLYAIFAKAIFYDGFDARAAGALDSNSTSGPNKSGPTDPSGNPWFGAYPDDCAVVASGAPTTNSGNRMVCASGTLPDRRNIVNLAYRCGGGSPLTGNFLFDWYFYDPKGSGAGANSYNDYAALCLYPSSTMDGTRDYITASATQEVPATQRIAVGAWNTGDYTKYHLGVSSGGGSMVWSNTSATRSVGWHHGRISVGRSNDLSVYIDDMLNSISTLTAGSIGFNAIELLTRGNLSANTSGYFDDVSVLIPGTQSIDKWLTIGHYANSDQPSRLTTDYFAPSGTSESDMTPWPGQTYSGKTWTQCNGGVVNWNQIYGATTTYGVSYLFTYINNTSGSAITDADLTCGSDDGIRVWLNGSVVINNDINRSMWIDTDRCGPFTLPTGVSRLLVKVSQSTGDYKGEVRITHADGTPLSGVSCVVTESVPPTGTISINGGASTTTSQNVTLTLSATDNLSGVATMSFSNDNTNWSTPEAYETTKAWTLSVGNGSKTVYVKYTDNCGNSSVTSAGIQLACVGYALLLPSSSTAGGSTTGSAFYQSGDPCHIVATANAGYLFAGWSTDQAGSSVVSTSSPYDFNMPAQDYTLYAQFTHTPYTLAVYANAGGTLGANPSGTEYYNDSVTAVAVPNVGYCFKGWTTTSDGSGTPESLAMSYTFRMPNAAKTLYANFAPQSTATWTEDFERYAAGDIDMNGAANAAANGNLVPTPFATNPWFGANPADCQIIVGSSSPTAHSGTRMLYVPASGYDGESCVNIGYRLNGDHAYSQSICLDWYFYDPNGTANGGNYRDFAGLASYPRNPILGTSGSGMDHNLTSTAFTNDRRFQRFWQQFAAIGASWDTSTGYDGTAYQIHVGPYSSASVPGSYAAGWCNTTVTRSVGWHHARITVGTVKPASGTSDISFYIDNMDTPAAVKDSQASLGFNAVSAFIRPNGFVTGYMDDFSFGPVANQPAAGASVPGTDRIVWNWTVSPAIQAGSNVYDAATGGSVKQNITGTTTTWTETGLTSNAPYSRWVTAYSTAETSRTALPTAYTLAVSAHDPGVSVYTSADNAAFYTTATWPGFTFASPGFGDTPGLVSKFKYRWSVYPLDTLAEGDGTDWSGGALMEMPPIVPPDAETLGTYYLYLRSYNAAGVGNPNVARLGPFNFGSNPNLHLVMIYNCNPEAGKPTGPGSAVYGTSATVHANANAGYSFVNWTSAESGCGAGGASAVSTLPDYTFDMPASDYILFANYTPNSYALTVNACSGGTATGGGNHTTGESVTVTAAPAAGCGFKNWTTDGCGGTAVVSTDNPYTFNMTPNDLTLTANFQVTPRLTLHALPTAGGTLTGGGEYPIGSAVTVTATANAGYRFLGWALDPSGLAYISTASSYGGYTMPSTDADLYAVFAGTDLVFQDSFENGMSDWAVSTSATYIGTTVSDSYANTGTHSLLYDNLQIKVFHDLGTAVPAGSKVAFRFWVRDPGPDSSRGYLADMRNADLASSLFGAGAYTGSKSVYESRLLGAGSGTAWSDLTGATRLYCPAPPAAQIWNRFDIYYDGGSHAYWYVNGVLRRTATDVSGSQITKLYVGYGTTTSAATPAAYFDDIACFTNPKLLTTGVQAGNGTVSGAQHGATLKGSLNGYYYPMEELTLTASPAAGYIFVSWVGADGTTVVSTANPYVLAMPSADTTVKAVFARDPNQALLTLNTNPAGACTLSGSGYYAVGGSVTALATPNAGYTFVKWSSDAAGTDVISTSASYTFTITADTSLYAIFTRNPQTLVVGAYPAAGGAVTGGGTFGTGSNVTAGAVANPNFRFVGWSTAANGSAMVSDKPSYTFGMPAINPYTLYAVFAKAIFYDGFDARANGVLDSDYGGPNAGANGDLNSNPWFGPSVPNSAITTGITGIPVNSGGKMLGASAGYMNCQNDMNIAYRCNGGLPLASNFLFDWYFYDPKGSGTGNTSYNDYAALCLYPGTAIDGTTDYINSDNLTPAHPPTKRLAVGAWNATGADFSRYHLGVSSGGGAMAWTNMTVARSIGWHHGRIAVGSSKDVSVFIDDMLTAAATLTVESGGFNAVELMCRGNSNANTTGYFDDLSLLVPGTQSIDKWSVIGHYPYSSNDTLPGHLAVDCFSGSGASESSMCASAGKTYNGKTWALCNGGVVNFNQYYCALTTYGISYLFTYIVNAGAPITDADLTCGSDDGVKVFLNGTPVIDNDAYRALWQNADEGVPLTIPTGVSRLMVKISQGVGDYKGQARLTHSDGTPLAGVTFVASDDSAPTGSVLINGGASSTGAASVTLTLSATDDLSGVSQMQFSNDGISYAARVPYAASLAYTLPAGDGAKTVYVKFIDGAGNVSAPASTTIILTTGPQPPPACTERTKISDLWPLTNDAAVYGLDNGSAKTVTAVWSDGFWIEETNRYAGIKVQVGGGTYTYFDDPAKSSVQPGDLVDVYGNLSVTSGSDRVLNANYVRDRTVGTGAAIAPLGVTQRYLVGKQASINTPGLPSGKGIYSAGLFVKLAGSVLTPGTNTFFLDDKTYLPGTGIQVFCRTLPVPTSGNKVVTGVAGMVGNTPIIYATSIQ